MDPSNLLREYINAILDSREEDFQKIQAANESYDAILGYIRRLDRNPKAFARVFQTNDQGFFTGFALGARVRREEHLQLAVFFMDRGLAGIKSKVNAQASRIRVRPMSTTAAAIKSFQIRIYFDAPEEARTNPKVYNKWLAANLEDLLTNDGTRSSYVHEFTHVQDFKRMDPQFLLQRDMKKQAEKERQQKAGEKSRDFGTYANDPLELNAYFSQAMSDVMGQLKGKSPEERTAIIGSSPQEFVDRFMGTYLKKQVKKNINPENWRRLAKRAATSWELLIGV